MSRRVHGKLLAPFVATIVLAIGAAAWWYVAEPQNAPGLMVAPGELDFESLRAGEVRQRLVTVTNLSEEPLQVDRVSVPSPFQATVGSLSLEAGQSFDIGVMFQPAVAGAFEATLRLEGKGGGAEVALRGEATGLPEIAAHPLALGFGDVAIDGEASAVIELENRGQGDLHFEASAPFGYRVSPEAADLAPGARTELAVTFAPSAAGTFQGHLKVSSNDPTRSLVLLNVRGNGVERAPQPAIAVDSARVDFGVVGVGETAKRWISIGNEGRDPLAIATLHAPAPFDVSARSRHLEPGRFLEFPVLFSPSRPGKHLESLVIHSNDPSVGNVTVDLVGEGGSAARTASTPSDASRGSETEGTEVARLDGGSGRADSAPEPADPAEGSQNPEEPNLAELDPERLDEEAPAPEPLSAARAEVLDGSLVYTSTGASFVGESQLGNLSLDAESGIVTLTDLELPGIETFGVFYEIEPVAESFGSVNELGDVEIVVPITVSNGVTEATEFVTLTTGSATTVERGMQYVETGSPVGPDGSVSLVGLATFRRPPLANRRIGIRINVDIDG